ncbi:arginase family protein [Streptomyces sp. A7024]|uniref:Arginase family protein n=1 Tax=Streptomyces coryli TaxID=1128680 RepID=A0A6G4TQY9_9ACTN|nr:arginase family protein [Streptomyces coryli]NGN62429.1 arginase family protein [Streptomyces coryli]
MRLLTILDAPSNLGLRPPEEGSVPGCYKAPGVFRDAGLLTRLGARDAGVLTAPRYRAAWVPGNVRNEADIATYARDLADRLAAILDAGELPVVLGGDCSILLGPGLALHRRPGRYGLVSLDGLDYRHPGNSTQVGAAGGESLAMVTGKGGILAELDGARPYLRPEDTVAMGIRSYDESAAEAAADGLRLIDAAEVGAGPGAAAARALAVVEPLDGFWIHLDADVLDPAVMPAVDAADPGGISFDELEAVLGGLLASPGVLGLDVTIYDPDRDPGFAAGRRLADVLVAAFGAAKTSA